MEMTWELAYKLHTSVLFRSAGGGQDQLQFLSSQVNPHHLHRQTTEGNEPGNPAVILLADIWAGGVAIEQSWVTIILLVPLELLSYLIFIPPHKGMEKNPNQQAKIWGWEKGKEISQICWIKMLGRFPSVSPKVLQMDKFVLL